MENSRNQFFDQLYSTKSINLDRMSKTQQLFLFCFFTLSISTISEEADMQPQSSKALKKLGN